MATVNQNIDWFFDVVLFGNIHNLVTIDEQHYLGFGVIACATEFLGACTDSQPFDKSGLSEKRFNSAIKNHFDSKYHQYLPRSSPHNLYKHLRCGMAHIIRPQGHVAFTTRAESVTDGTKHLAVHQPTGKLILISESFLEDFENAARDVKAKMSTGTFSKKLTDPYLPISS